MGDRLAAFALGSFHAALLLVVAVSLGYRTGNLGGILAVAGTGPGLLLGGILWLLAWGATAWTLDGQDLHAPTVRPLLERAFKAGMAAGALFVPSALVVLAAANGEVDFVLVVVGVFSALGGALGGSLVGTALALVDAGFHLVARRALTASSA